MNDGADGQLRLLVAIASYGTSNDKYLLRLLDEYRAMPYSTHIVVLSNISCQAPMVASFRSQADVC